MCIIKYINVYNKLKYVQSKPIITNPQCIQNSEVRDKQEFTIADFLNRLE